MFCCDSYFFFNDNKINYIICFFIYYIFIHNSNIKIKHFCVYSKSNFFLENFRFFPFFNFLSWYWFMVYIVIFILNTIFSLLFYNYCIYFNCPFLKIIQFLFAFFPDLVIIFVSILLIEFFLYFIYTYVKNDFKVFLLFSSFFLITHFIFFKPFFFMLFFILAVIWFFIK